MRVYLLFKIIIVLYLAIGDGNRVIELEQLASAIEGTNGIINEWSLYAREPIKLTSNKQVIEKVEWLKSEFPQMTWSEIENDQSMMWIGQLVTTRKTETIKLIYSQGEQSYMMYQLGGRGTPSKSEYFNTKIQNLFEAEPSVFSCIKGVFIEGFTEVSKYKKDEILNLLQAKEVESLKEEQFMSISAYTPTIEHAIPSKENEMNVQLALRKISSGETEFTIGTPILTIEY